MAGAEAVVGVEEGLLKSINPTLTTIAVPSGESEVVVDETSEVGLELAVEVVDVVELVRVELLEV